MQRDQKQLLAGEAGSPGNSQYKDHLIVHFTRNGRVNKTNFYHMQVLLQFPKGNAFKPELRRANSCIRSLWAVKRSK